MTDIRYTHEFEKQYRDLPPAVQGKAEKREALFRSNPFHPSLKTEKLSPKEKEYWSFRIDREYRIIFRFGENRIIYFLACGQHNWIYRYVLRH